MALSVTQIAALRKISDTCYGIGFSESAESIALTEEWSYVHCSVKLATYNVTITIDINTGSVSSDCVTTCIEGGEGRPFEVIKESGARSAANLTDKVKKTLFADSKARMTDSKEKADAIALKYCLEMNQPAKHEAFSRVGNIIYRAIFAKKPISEKRIARMFAIANAAH